MKTTRLIVALAFTATAASLFASDKDTNKTPASALVKKAKASQRSTTHLEKTVALTGSYIKKDVRRAGVVTNGADPLYVIDGNSIYASGGADLSQVLFRSGFRR